MVISTRQRSPELLFLVGWRDHHDLVVFPERDGTINEPQLAILLALVRLPD
jgi:hypothetical protein